MLTTFIRRLRGRRQHARGQSIVEFALVIPIMLLLLAMAVDLGRLFYAQVSVVNASKEGAAYGATNPICVDDARTLCQGNNNVEARVALEAGGLPGGVSASVVRCLAPGGAVRTPLTECRDGDTYEVQATHTFRLLTPILGQVLGDSIVLVADSRSRVLNLAFDPTPGAAITKEACAGAGCTDFALTPITDDTNTPIYLEVESGTVITYRLTVTNIGGETLTSGTISDNRGSLPFGAAGCPSFPTTIAVGVSWSCVYTRTAPNTGGPPEMLYENVATVDAANIQPRQGAATVKVIAAPAQLAIGKSVSVYQAGGTGNGPFGSDDTLTAHRNAQIPTVEIWYRISVQNVGGQNATGFAVSDQSGALPTGTTLCQSIPGTLAPGSTWTCRYSRTFIAVGSTTQIATASGTNVDTVTDSTTVQVQQCATPSLVIPKLVGLSPRNAVQSGWTSAGYASGQLTTWGSNPNQTAATQTVRAYTCTPSNQTMTVAP